MKTKKAAMEMSVGTIVTIVLLMTVLILGLVLVRTIFKSSVENVDSINTAVRGEIDKLFSEDENRKIIIYPPTREVIIRKGEDNRGFGLFIRNLDETEKFSYDISAEATDCEMRLTNAEDLISLNKQRTITIPGGNVMEDDIVVKFKIPESTPPCTITYSVNVERGTAYYASTDVYVTIKSK